MLRAPTPSQAAYTWIQAKMQIACEETIFKKALIRKADYGMQE